MREGMKRMRRTEISDYDSYPFYWQHVNSDLTALVKKFFSDSLLSEAELFQLKAYVWQWILLGPQKKPKSWDERLANCKTKAQLMDYVRNLLLQNRIDPF